MRRSRLPPLDRAHWSILALAASKGEVSMAQHRRRAMVTLIGHGLLAPVAGSLPAQGRYRLTDAGTKARDLAPRMSLTPPGETLLDTGD